MSENNPLQLVPGDLRYQSCTCLIGEMAVPGHDPLLYRPWSLEIIAKKPLVMIHFDKQRVDVPNSLEGQLRRVAQIGEDPNRCSSTIQNKGNRINGVVRNIKALYLNVLDGKGVTGLEEPPTGVFIKVAAANGVCCLGSGKDRNSEMAAEHLQAANVIDVFVSDKDAVETSWVDAAISQAFRNLACAQARVDQELALVGRDQITISQAPAAENG
jgi:hypothetical protein